MYCKNEGITEDLTIGWHISHCLPKEEKSLRSKAMHIYKTNMHNLKVKEDELSLSFSY